MDLVVRSRRIPKAGETIAGSEFQLVPGGKGANQAIASSRFGAATTMFGCVGKDAFAPVLIESLKSSSVSTEYLQTSREVSTGTATIIVEDDGENRIIVVAGANGRVLPDYIESVWDEISKSSIILLQHEIPLDTIFMIIDKAAAEGIPVYLNPAPYYPIYDEILKKINVIILNESEGSSLSGVQIKDLDTAVEAAERLLQKGIGTVIVTLGQQGSVLVNQNERIFQPAFKVKAVDTTAAGDTFVGVFAASMLDGKSSREALKFATAAAGLTVTRKGAQPSIPDYKEVCEFVKQHQ
jgi:ribokinase